METGARRKEEEGEAGQALHTYTPADPNPILGKINIWLQLHFLTISGADERLKFIEADMAEIVSYYRDAEGKHPEKFVLPD